MPDKTLKRAAAALIVSAALHAVICLIASAGARLSPVRIRPVRLNVSELEFSVAAKMPTADQADNVSCRDGRRACADGSAIASPPEVKWSAPPSPVKREILADVSPPIEKPSFKTPEKGGAEEDRASVRAEAKPLGSIVPVYPRASRLRGEEGVVRLEALVDRTGSVAEVRVCASSGYSRLDEAAATALGSAKFEPATSGGTAVVSRVSMPFIFKLNRR